MAPRDLPIVRVTLTYQEEEDAHTLGFKRATEQKSVANYSTRKNKGLNYHEYIAELAESVGSEIATAKFFGLEDFRPTVNTFKNQADVGSNIEVKWTKWREGHLVIGQSDRNGDIAILVTGKTPEYFLVGWIPISHAKVRQHWSASNSNWWVNQEHLRPMQDFLGSDYANATFPMSKV